jgi:hypothetical protein
MLRNIESVFGASPALWCGSGTTVGNGVKFDVATDDGEWIELQAHASAQRRRWRDEEEDA